MTTTTDLLTTAPCTQCVKHPGWLASQDRPDGRYVGEVCPACQGSLVMNVAVPMPTKGYATDWTTSPSDVAFYDALTDAMRADLKDEWGTMLLTLNERTILLGGECGWSEGFCSDCGEYVETASIVYNLRWDAGSDQPQWDEADEVCTDCGEVVHYREKSEAVEAARQDAAERAWEARREEGW